MEDLDISTSFSPEDVLQILPHLKSYGSVYGVLAPAGKQRSRIHVVSFRKERKGYDRARRPIQAGAGNWFHDAVRRDFPMNALYWDPIGQVCYDFFCGKRDLRKGVISCIGDPFQRFQEDPLRILRAFRFCIVYGLKFEKPLQDSLYASSFFLDQLSKHHWSSEFNKVCLAKREEFCFSLFQNFGHLPCLMDFNHWPLSRESMELWEKTKRRFSH